MPTMKPSPANAARRRWTRTSALPLSVSASFGSSAIRDASSCSSSLRSCSESAMASPFDYLHSMPGSNPLYHLESSENGRARARIRPRGSAARSRATRSALTCTAICAVAVSPRAKRLRSTVSATAARAAAPCAGSSGPATAAAGPGALRPVEAVVGEERAHLAPRGVGRILGGLAGPQPGPALHRADDARGRAHGEHDHHGEQPAERHAACAPPGVVGGAAVVVGEGVSVGSSGSASVGVALGVADGVSVG